MQKYIELLSKKDVVWHKKPSSSSKLMSGFALLLDFPTGGLERELLGFLLAAFPSL